MGDVLRISVQLLTARFHGHRGDGSPEWPPSPFRLFQALLAGARTGAAMREWTPRREAAFLWLEGQLPPDVVAPDVHTARTYRVYVPNNDLDRVAQDWVRGKFDPMAAAFLKTPKDIATQLIASDVPAMVHFVWDVGDGVAREHAREMVQATQHLFALGAGVDMAAAHGAIEDAGTPHVGRRWIPRADGACDLAIPTTGSLRSLERRYEAFTSRVRGKTINLGLPHAMSRVVGYGASDDLAMRPYASFHLVDNQGRARSFPPRALHRVSAMVRHAAIEAARADGRPAEWVRDFVAGHGEGPAKSSRFSYLPAPSIGHRYADGGVRRFLLAGPLGSATVHTEWAASRLDGAPLIDEKTGEVHATLSQAREDGVFDLYCGRSTRWTSVTPVVLPGHDDHDVQKALGLFERALDHAGLRPAVADFTVRREPFWSGSRHCRNYDVPAHLRGFVRYHAAVTFRTAVRGPITIGAGRYLGYGLLAASR